MRVAKLFCKNVPSKGSKLFSGKLSKPKPTISLSLGTLFAISSVSSLSYFSLCEESKKVGANLVGIEEKREEFGSESKLEIRSVQKGEEEERKEERASQREVVDLEKGREEMEKEKASEKRERLLRRYVRMGRKAVEKKYKDLEERFHYNSSLYLKNYKLFIHNHLTPIALSSQRFFQKVKSELSLARRKLVKDFTLFLLLPVGILSAYYYRSSESTFLYFPFNC